MNGKNIGWLRAAVVASLLVGTSAHAQWDPESGDTGQWTPPPAEQPPAQQPPQQQQQQQPPAQQPPAQQPPANGWQQAPAQQPQQQQQQQQQGWFNGQNGERPPGQGGPAAETPEQEAPAGTTDHSQVSFGVSFFGLDSLTLMPESAANDAITLRMPAIGVRYWVSDTIGLDIGLGLGIIGEKQFNNCQIDPASGNCGPEARTGGIDGGFGIRLHFGLPVALKTYEHFNILITPELGFQYGQATIYTPETIGNEAADALDLGISSIALDVGLKIGGELQFGFWGVPNLALQANIGLGLRYQSTTMANDVSLANAGRIVDLTSTSLSLRTIADDLTGAVRILYYF